MDATPEISDSIATPAEAPVDAPPAAWQLAALLQPAFVGGDRWLPVLPRLWLEWAVQSAGRALERTLDRSTVVTFSRADQPALREAVFAVSFEHPALSGLGIVSVDLPCARLMLDALETDFANVRGTGALSQAELGLLEYIALATLDGVLRASTTRGFVVRGFHDGRSARAVTDPTAAVAPISLNVHCAGREGFASLHLPGIGGLVSAAIPGGVNAAPVASLIDLRVALPPVTLSRSDAAALQPKDVLLLGATDLQSFASSCRLATGRGWSVASAAIVRDSPTVIDVRCGPFALDVLPTTTPGSEQAILNPLVGLRRLSTEHLERWQTGAILDLPKDLMLPVELFDGPLPVARGELIRLDGEVGVRVVKIHRPTGKGAIS